MREPAWHGASFRDPSGHILTVDGELYRTVSEDYARDYDRLMSSGLYRAITDAGQLIAHEEVRLLTDIGGTYRVLRPERIPFVSYPWEWSFSQLRDAALLTLDIAEQARERDMVLKDASAFNVQFIGTRPVFIDTLSFETQADGGSWVAYRQFCEHFLAPLELRRRVHPSLAGLSREYLDGVPLEVAHALLPVTSRLRPSTMMHIHAHSAAQRRYADAQATVERPRFVSDTSRRALLESLRSAVKACRWEPNGTEWSGYYENTNYEACSMEHKTSLTREFLHAIAPRTIWDLGANTGRFSRIAVESGAYTVSLDVDHGAVEKAYRAGRETGEERILPLVADLMNPTPNMGWALRERDSLFDRGSPDGVLALALIHHIAIANNVPLPRIAALFADLAPWLIIEFVPKSDSQVRRMLSSRRDIFSSYTREGFEAAFKGRFVIERSVPLAECDRVMYLMRTRSDA